MLPIFSPFDAGWAALLSVVLNLTCPSGNFCAQTPSAGCRFWQKKQQEGRRRLRISIRPFVLSANEQRRSINWRGPLPSAQFNYLQLKRRGPFFAHLHASQNTEGTRQSVFLRCEPTRLLWCCLCSHCHANGANLFTSFLAVQRHRAFTSCCKYVLRGQADQNTIRAKNRHF